MLTSGLAAAVLAGVTLAHSAAEAQFVVDRDPVRVRDAAIARARSLDLRPVLGPNWGNGKFDAWTDYLVGDSTEAQYLAAAVPPDYRFDDAWGFARLPGQRVNYAETRGSCYLGLAPVNPLAARFAKTGAAKYAARYLAVVRDMAVNERAALAGQPRSILNGVRGCARDLASGNAEALLMYGWSVNAFASGFGGLAKTLGRSPRPWDDGAVAPVTAALTAADRDLVDAGLTFEAVGGFATTVAPLLLKYYEVPGRVLNQRASALAGLGLVGYTFIDHPDVLPLVPRIGAAIDQLATESVYADGGLVEASFNYNWATVDDLRRLAGLRHIFPWAGKAAMLGERFDLAMAAIAAPGGGLPQVGNTLWNKGRKPTPHTFGLTSLTLPYSGYTALRSGWDDAASYLFFYNWRDAHGHAMAGSNSIQLAAGGRRLLVAGGIPNYSGLNAEYPASVAYLSEASTYKTSTVLVDNQSQSHGNTAGLRMIAGKPDRERAALFPVDARFSTSSRFDFTEGLYTGGYGPVTDTQHWRGVVFLRNPALWVVVDVLRSTGNHAYTQVWKFAEPVTDAGGVQIEGFHPEQVSLDPAGRRIFTTDATPGAVNLSIRQFGPSLGYARHWGADKGPFGYVGKTFSTGLGFSPDVHATFGGRGDQVVVSVIRATPSAVGDDGIRGVTAVSGAGVTGADLVFDDSFVSVRAGARGTASIRGSTCGAANLVVTVTQGAARDSIVIGDPAVPACSYQTVAGRRTPVSKPSLFRWSTSADGTLTPVYR
ncbi:heparinase II/III domain-containing protein [Prosthecomicrobium sp. N25]|uniref:heparinase II/III domain-containing protein n=1 Tax=Prosthecomicrobium sp. N25 TaxID=3129254 RepID=UPI0030776272